MRASAMITATMADAIVMRTAIEVNGGAPRSPILIIIHVDPQIRQQPK